MEKTFKIPHLPPSLNQTYKINYRTKQMYLDKSAVDFKRNAILFIPKIEVDEEGVLEVLVEYHGKFLNKDGTTKRRDGQNLDKVLYDVIFERLGLDDSIVWKGSWIKKHNEKEEFTVVTIKQS